MMNTSASGNITNAFFCDGTVTHDSSDSFWLGDNCGGRHIRIIHWISPPQFYLAFIILHRGLVNILCLWGLFGNILSVLVLTRQRLKDTVNILLTSIAVCDIVFCGTQLMQEAIFILKEYNPEASGNFLVIYMQGILQWNHLALTSSIYNVAIIGVERLIAVCFPFRVSRLCTPYRTKWLILVTEIFIFTFTFPAYFLSYEFKLQDNEIVSIMNTWIRPTNYPAMIYWVYLMPLVQVILPLCLLIVCYTVIVSTLQSSSAKTSQLTAHCVRSSQVKEHKMFRLLLTLMTVTLISFMPSVLVSLTLSYGILDVELDRDSFDLVRILAKVCNHVFTSVNFIIYVTMSSKFAKAFPKILSGYLQ